MTCKDSERPGFELQIDPLAEGLADLVMDRGETQVRDAEHRGPCRVRLLLHEGCKGPGDDRCSGCTGQHDPSLNVRVLCHFLLEKPCPPNLLGMSVAGAGLHHQDRRCNSCPEPS